MKTDEIGDLQLILPGEASGEAKLLIQLVTPEGAVIADTATVLKLIVDATISAGASSIKTESELAQVWDQPTQKPERALARSDAAMAGPGDGDPVPLPKRRSAQSSNDEANWVTLTSVNLRERPTRSARAIGVVAKDAKLRVVARKNRWV